jgi:hypothetical protein
VPFDILKPKKNAKGNGCLPEDSEKTCSDLSFVKRRGFTLEGQNTFERRTKTLENWY